MCARLSRLPPMLGVRGGVPCAQGAEASGEGAQGVFSYSYAPHQTTLGLHDDAGETAFVLSCIST